MRTEKQMQAAALRRRIFFFCSLTCAANELTLHLRESTLQGAHACVCTVRGVPSAIVQK